MTSYGWSARFIQSKSDGLPLKSIEGAPVCNVSQGGLIQNFRLCPM